LKFDNTRGEKELGVGEESTTNGFMVTDTTPRPWLHYCVTAIYRDRAGFLRDNIIIGWLRRTRLPPGVGFLRFPAGMASGPFSLIFQLWQIFISW